MKKHSDLVLIEAVTWSRESQGLFDYESQHVSRKTLKASSSAKIIRIKNDIRLSTDTYNEKNMCENSKTLALLKDYDGIFTVTRLNQNSKEHKISDSDNLWLVVKDIKNDDVNQEYQLKEQDIIKLGRVKFRVKELRANKNITMKQKGPQIEEIYAIQSDNSGRFEEDLPKQHFIKKEFESQDLSCRVCLSSESSEDNPFISPCACAGSVKHIHLDCLKEWIKSKRNIRSDGLYVSYSWETLKCELCHHVLPEIFLHNGNKIDLIDIPKPQSSYIILETLPSGKQSNKTFYVILANEKEVIRIGREHDCDVILNDISATRIHAFIRFSQGKFYLGDNNSKYGTLVLLKNDLVIKPSYKTSIQIGRTVLSFNIISKNQQTYENNIFKTLSSFGIQDNQSCHKDLNKFQTFLQKNNDSKFSTLMDISDSTLTNDKSNSSYFISRKQDASSINSKLFNLTLDKDKDDFIHLQELIQNHTKYRTNENRARSSEEKVRERKNILDEMKNLNINSDDEDKENGEEENGDFLMESKMFRL